jgi:protein-tyrosine phosphatase
VIDLHCHVLPGIDDGPQTIEESLAMARVAAAAGTRVLVATPHVNHRYENRAARIEPLVAELNRVIAEEGLALEVRPGAEIALLSASGLDAEELLRLRLGGGPWLLVEPPTASVEADVEGLVMALLDQGHRVLLAHPERCPAFRRDPGTLASLVGEGVLASVTTASLRGHFGEEVARFALELLRSELVQNVASDAHHHELRPPTMCDELDRAGLGGLAEWLTAKVPEAILEGTDIPQRPLVRAAPQTRSTWVRREPTVRAAGANPRPAPPPASSR